MRTLIVVARQCPIGAIGAYGNDWIATPTLDRLAAEGITWDQHLSDHPQPAAANRAWRTGLHQTPGIPREAHQAEDLLEALNRAGTKTILIEQSGVESLPEFYAGWQERFDARPSPADGTPIDLLLTVLPEVASHLGESWLLWLDWNAFGRPWYIPAEVFGAYIDEEETAEEPVPAWADPPTGWFDRDDLESWEYLHRSFAAAMTTFDVQLGQVLAKLEELGLLKETRILFTTDHGTPLGEHGQIGIHTPQMHEELVHLPLIVKEPGGLGGKRITRVTQPADLMPTILRWHGISVPDGLDGEDLQTSQSHREAIGGLVQGDLGEWYLRTADRHLILPMGDDERGVQMYQKPEDRWEVNNLRASYLEETEELEARLRSRLQQHP
ncbi:MAG: sulfatase family protein [Fimbriiglobus sp.]